MPGRKKRLAIQITRDAERDLVQIHEWTERHFGRRNADKYIDFLEKETIRLSEGFPSGVRALGETGMYFRVVKKTRAKTFHGHVIVVEKVDQVLFVLHYFHTASDWKPD